MVTLAGFVVKTYLGRRAAGNMLSGKQAAAPHRGPLEFVSYTSSPFEKMFMAAMPEMIFPQHESGDSPVEYCKFVDTQREKIQTWLSLVKVQPHLEL